MLSIKQKGVLRGMIIGAGCTILIIMSAILLNPFGFSKTLLMSTRIVIAIQSFIFLALSLMVSIGRIARYRFFSTDDIDGGGLTQGSNKIKILQSLLQNTMEQCTLAVLVYLLWAVIMPATWLSIIPMAAMIFFIGRILFYSQYHKGAQARAFGFTLSFYPTVAMLILIIIRFLFLGLQ